MYRPYYCQFYDISLSISSPSRPTCCRQRSCGWSNSGYNEVFVARHQASHIEVYDSHNLILTRRLKISDLPLNWPIIGSCRHNNYFYLYLTTNNDMNTDCYIYLLKLDDSSSVLNRRMTSYCRGLSVTQSCHFLVTIINPTKILELRLIII